MGTVGTQTHGTTGAMTGPVGTRRHGTTGAMPGPVGTQRHGNTEELFQVGTVSDQLWH